MGWLCAGLGTVAAGLTVFSLGLGWAEAKGSAGRLAGMWLVAPHLRGDWEWAMEACAGLGLSNGLLAEHVELAGIQRRWFFKTEQDEIYRRWVLFPVVGESEDRAWRRPLWEGLSQHVRRVRMNRDAATIVRRKLYERVALDEGAAGGLMAAWRERHGSEEEFEALTVAALRSVGVPARLTNSLAVFYDVGQWRRFESVDSYVRVIREGVEGE